ncbi:SLOG family protein [Streptomyces sp. 5-10]|uniref:SLOG family protein n=1 Tax=Streptomyces sp. 5-10 TaxID=878925 RepID=UPI00168C058D|nr:DUF2493 domain-containing protein [Streptomyces sp. 5-10]
MENEEFRLLFCGSRHYPWPRVVHQALDRFHYRYGNRLVVIEGKARGADIAAHNWCEKHGLPLGERHLCFPVNWGEARRTRPDWRRAGNERNTEMLKRSPHQVVGFHNAFEYERGGTSDMMLKSLLCGVPTWLIPGNQLADRYAPDLARYPAWRLQQARAELQKAGLAVA